MPLQTHLSLYSSSSSTPHSCNPVTSFSVGSLEPPATFLVTLRTAWTFLRVPLGPSQNLSFPQFPSVLLGTYNRYRSQSKYDTLIGAAARASGKISHILLCEKYKSYKISKRKPKRNSVYRNSCHACDAWSNGVTFFL